MVIVIAAIAISLSLARARNVWWVWKPSVFNTRDARWVAEILIAYGNTIKFMFVRLAPSMIAQSFAIALIAWLNRKKAGKTASLHYGILGNACACASWLLLGILLLTSYGVAVVDQNAHPWIMDKLWSGTVLEVVNVIGATVTGCVVLTSWMLVAVQGIPRLKSTGFEAWGVVLATYWIMTSLLIVSTTMIKMMIGPEGWYPLNVTL
ncbi:hypothetical protein [Singulisphaera sp. PoT]|uniref:hypothetical protein n=1 Tax=Singulisphaera sp. PoT TaxID=3411797 RepID=UPI003BF47D1D